MVSKVGMMIQGGFYWRAASDNSCAPVMASNALLNVEDVYVGEVEEVWEQIRKDAFARMSCFPSFHSRTV